MTDPVNDSVSSIAHLHVHTEYSLLDGAIRIKDLIKRAKELGHTAVAITDHGNLFAAIEFYTKAKGTGVKPIIGSEIFHPGTEATHFYMANAGETAQGSLPKGAFHLVLLAKNLAGYHNLIKLVSDGYLQGLEPVNAVPVVPETVLDQLGDGLIALSSCLRGEFGFLVNQLRQLVPKGELPFAAGLEKNDELTALDDVGTHINLAAEALREHVRLMRARFGDGNYYVELINNNLPEQKFLLPDLVAAAKYFDLPLVATADAHYLTKEQSESHAVLMGIKHSLTMSKIRGRRKGTRFHLFDNEEMQAIYGQWPEALSNSGKIADQCNVDFKFGQYFLPQFDAGTGETADELLRRLAREGLSERFVPMRKLYGPTFDAAAEAKYAARLEFELDVIIKMGFPGYFLIVQDFINWAKRQGIPVGPGRGSGAGSLVAYALRITDLDPIPYNLLFERFLNPDRISMPDFDVDFCQDRRDEVIKYVIAKYGSQTVAQITTYGKMNAKAVIRDVGRVMELGFGRVDRLARLIPEEIGITLDDAMKQEPRITEEISRDEAVGELWRLAKELEGISRHTSVHAAGIVISDGPMTNYVPVYVTAEAAVSTPGKNPGDKAIPGKTGISGLITQYDMKMAEKVGLVKFDFLGLKTLTVIEKAVQLVRQKKAPDFDIALIPMDDRKVYADISAGNSVGIFQLESQGMKNLITKLKPSCFEDIIAVVALFRPGPLGSGMVDDFIERKHGRQELAYPLPQLEPILKETYGIILYQEQVMKIAGELASYSLGEADLLRRAMGKKIAAEMEKQKSRFISGAVANQIPEEKAAEIFDLMAEFANYGFNKSHSAAYGLVTYQTAYLKLHYPEEFMAAIMTCDLDNTKKIVRYVDECRRLKLQILPPNINRSELVFDVPEATPKGVIGFGLAAIKGIGPQVVEPLIAERRRGGVYKSLSDLAGRVNLQKIGKKTLELLTQVGALDVFGLSRPKLCALIPELVKFSEAQHEARNIGQRGLFDDAPADEKAQSELSFQVDGQLSTVDLRIGAPNPEWLKKEKSLLGVYLTGHPLHFHQEDRRSFSRLSVADLYKMAAPKQPAKKNVTLVAVLANLNERITKSGTRMASLRLEDASGAIEAVMFQNEMPPEFPEANSIVVVTGSVDMGFDGSTVRYRLEKINGLEDMRQEHVRQAMIVVTPLVPAKVERQGGGAADKAKTKILPKNAVDPALQAKDRWQQSIQQLQRHVVAHHGDTPIKLVLRYPEADLKLQLKQPIALTDAFLHGLFDLPFASTEVRFEMFRGPQPPSE